MQTKLKEVRKAKNMNQEELAQKSGVARTVISQLENGSRAVVKTSTMVKLATALESKISDIFLL